MKKSRKQRTRKVILLGEPVLQAVARPIPEINREWVQTLADQLLATCKKAKGMGIAAPQIGESVQMFVVASKPNERYPEAPLMKPTVMINPRITARSTTFEEDWEGCLSIPGIRALVFRHSSVTVSYEGRDGVEHTGAVFHGFLARVIQHEYDHLNGIVFLDHVTDTRKMMSEQAYRDMMERKMEAAAKEKPGKKKTGRKKK